MHLDKWSRIHFIVRVLFLGFSRQLAYEAPVVTEKSSGMPNSTFPNTSIPATQRMNSTQAMNKSLLTVVGYVTLVGRYEMKLPTGFWNA